MARSDYSILVTKELNEIVRDLRTLILLCTISLILCPLSIVLITGSQEQLTASEKGKARISIQGNAGKLRTFLKKNPDFLVQTIAADTPEEELRTKRADLVVKVPRTFQEELLNRFAQTEINVYSDPKRSETSFGLARISDSIGEFQEKSVEERLDKYKVPDVWRPFLNPSYKNPGIEESESTYMLSIVLPFYLLLSIGTAIFSTAIHLFTGESEGKTLVTLFLTPAPRRTILLAKYTATCVLGLIVALLAISSAWVALSILPQARALPAAPLTDILTAYALLTLPAVMLIAAMAAVAASGAANLQQAQTYSTLSLIFLLGMCGLASIRSLHFDSVAQLVPIANLAIGMREAMRGNIAYSWIASAGAITVFYSLLILFFTTLRFKHAEPAVAESRVKKSIYSDGEPDEKPSTTQLIIFLSTSFLLMFYFGRPALSWDPVYGNAVIQLGMILLPALVFVKLLKLPFIATIKASPQRPTFVQIIGALTMAPITVVAAGFLIDWQGHFIPMSDQVQSMISEEDYGAAYPGWLPYICIAILPGVCEEIFFRGILLSALRKRMSTITAVILSSVIFGAFHTSIYRFTQTTFLGLIVGTLTAVTGSIYPAIALHVTHDALTIYGSSIGANMANPLVLVTGAFLGLIGVLLIALGQAGYGIVAKTAQPAARSNPRSASLNASDELSDIAPP